MLSDSCNGGYRWFLLKVSWVQIPLHCSKPKLRGAPPLHYRKIFTNHLLSKLLCKCTVPLHSLFVMGQLYLRFIKLSTVKTFIFSKHTTIIFSYYPYIGHLYINQFYYSKNIKISEFIIQWQ